MRQASSARGAWRHRRLWQALGGALVAAIVLGSLLPGDALPGTDVNDKLQHCLAYGMVMYWFAMIDRGARRRAAWAAAFVLLGVAIEFLQRASGYRDFELADMVADAVGVALGWALALSPAAGLLAWLDRKLA